MGCAGDTAVLALQSDRARAAREADAFGDLRHRADRGVLLLVMRHEQDALLIAGIDGESERHAREDDHVIQRD